MKVKEVRQAAIKHTMEATDKIISKVYCSLADS
jgi:hypothetical protein